MKHDQTSNALTTLCGDGLKCWNLKNVCSTLKCSIFSAAHLITATVLCALPVATKFRLVQVLPGAAACEPTQAKAPIALHLCGLDLGFAGSKWLVCDAIWRVKCVKLYHHECCIALCRGKQGYQEQIEQRRIVSVPKSGQSASSFRCFWPAITLHCALLRVLAPHPRMEA